jgi:DNA-binding transcriptional MerR regulator
MSSAAFAYPHKSAEAFRTISEVAIELDVPQHVLRFWESRFIQIRPVKRAGGRRYYRPEDIDLLKGIRALLYRDGLTIRGVQKVLKERGLRHVADLGRGQVPESAPQVVEKIVYVEKPVVAAPKKTRTSHLRAVSDTMDLPFFDEPAPTQEFLFESENTIPAMETDNKSEVVDEPLIGTVLEGAEEFGLDMDDRQRLEDLLDELKGLKAQLQAARERAQD